jgi:hypothetical protein
VQRALGLGFRAVEPPRHQVTLSAFRFCRSCISLAPAFFFPPFAFLLIFRRSAWASVAQLPALQSVCLVSRALLQAVDLDLSN